MNETMMREKIHQAVDSHCAHLKEDYWLANRVIAMAQEPETQPVVRRRKLPVALIVVLVLMLLSVTAVAAVVMSAKQIVEQELVPLAHESDVNDELGAVFTNAELQRIVEIARKNGIELPQELLDRTEQGLDYWEEETIMIFAREAFGGLYIDWTIEQKHWFGDVMVDIGFWSYNWDCVPGEGEITHDEAIAVATSYLLENYGDDVLDTERWHLQEQYFCTRDEATQQITSPEWSLVFKPRSIRDNYYWIRLTSRGETTSVQVDEAPKNNKKLPGTRVYDFYDMVYGAEEKWTPEVWVSIHNDMQDRFIDSPKCGFFSYLDFIMPPEGGLTQDEAKTLAMETIGRPNMATNTAVCCMAMDAPVWKVEVRATGEDNIITRWWIELDAMTGKLRDLIEFHSPLDPDAPPIELRYMPRDIYETYWVNTDNG